jgi:CreA protein
MRPPRHCGICGICGNHRLGVLGHAAGIGAAHAASGEKIGTVDIALQWIGRDHDTTGEAYDNPGIPGVTC